MSGPDENNNGQTETIQGHGGGDVSTILSVDDVAREAAKIADAPSLETLDGLVKGDPILTIDHLVAGYGKMHILHDLALRVGKGQSLCLIGPNGAGKSTILHAIYGLAKVFSGTIKASGTDITRLSTNAKLSQAGIAYILQDNSVFPDMTVEENLLMGGFLLKKKSQAQESAEQILQKYPRLKARRKESAGALSGGERRLLEISRALVMSPEILLVDEPSIGLEPRYIDMVFEILTDLRDRDGKTIIMVEQNARKGLAFADIGYVLVSGELAKAGTGDQLLGDPDVGRLFLGG